MATKKLNRWSDDDTNYCLVEANASMKCLSRNNYNKDACENYFAMYKSCKKEWNEIKNERRRQGLTPNPSRDEMVALKLEKNKRLQENDAS